MAALIQHHSPATVSAGVGASSSSSSSSSSGSHRLSHPSSLHAISYLSHSKPPIISSVRTHLFPNLSSPLSSLPSIQHFPIPNPNKPSNPLSNHDLSQLLRLSINYCDIQLNKATHASILKIQPDIRLFNSLITSYIRLNNFSYAEKVFKSIFCPDVVSYTAMISGLAKSSREEEAVELFFQMRGLGVEPNGYTFVALFTACMRLTDLDLGSQVHALAIKTGHVVCTYVANSLMGLYCNCNCLDYAINLFDEMSERDIASWNTMISFLVKAGMYARVLELFRNLVVEEEFRVDYFTLSSLLVACAKCFAVKEGMGIHAYAYKLGYENHLSVKNALIEFYAKCGYVEDVENLFSTMPLRDVFTWTEMISAYMGFGLVNLAVDVFDRMPEKNCVSYNALLSGFCRNGEGFRACRLFCRMVEDGMELDDITLTNVLHACGITKDRRSSEQIHAFVHKINVGANECIQSALLDTCTRCGRMDDAEFLFQELLQEQISPIMLTTMICGYARNGELDKTISLISRWQHEGYCEMDEVALASILGVCGDLGFQKLGEQFHCFALKYSFLSGVVGNAVVSMYSKCGDIGQATKAFNCMPFHDTVSWNSLLAGHILNRQGDEALTVWKKMQKGGIQPDTITCALILSAYHHTNSILVQDCQDFFISMKSVYHIEPDMDHYVCLVSVLGHWGFLEEAEETIKKMPFEPKASVWRALLNSCRIHKNTAIGRQAAKNILSIKQQDPSTYILQSNLYSASGRWHCSERIREEMKARGFEKLPVQSWIIHRNQVHSFHARDKSHPQSKDIYSALDILFLECLKAGYTPDTSFVLQEAEEHQKANFLLYHSGKLAVTYGLLVNNRAGEAVRVMKNVHLCGDCHTFFKYVSVVTKRVIEVRDTSGFHCFAHGQCSCNDCW